MTRSHPHVPARSLVSNRGLAAATVVLALVASACGGSDTDASETTSTSVTQTTASTTTTTAPESTTTTSTTAAPTATSVAESELPGVSFDFGPAEGSSVAVVGVAADDVLNVRQLPDPSSAIVTELDPTGDATLTNRKRDLGTSIWYEVETAAGIGWANASFLAPTGGTRDATNEFTDLLGELPTGASSDEVIAELQQVLVAYGAEQEGPPMTVTIVDGPHTGDLDEVTIDVLGYADDAVRGDRLHVFIMNEGDTSAIKTIEATSLCQRGSDGAFCL
ncbi:MAG: SH3 domain-containing protein [Acidimicrobiales bacterium]